MPDMDESLLQEELGGQRFRIYPVTRIEGRADIEVLFDPQHEVKGARFRALELRGIEQLVVGVHALVAPRVIARTCGSCGFAHQLAACMAVEDAGGVEVPPAALQMRELASQLQLASSHLLTITYRSLPDYALPMSDTAVRNVTGLYMVEQEALSRLATIQAAFTEALSLLAGGPGHPALVVPGGVSSLPSPEVVEKVDGLLAVHEDDLRETLRLVEMLVRRDARLMDTGQPMPGYYASMVGDGVSDLLGDQVAVAAFNNGEQELLDPGAFARRLEKRPVPWSYLVPVELDGAEPLLVGPLARVNNGFASDTAWADLECKRAREQWGERLDREFLSFLAMMLEVIRAWELARQLLGSGALEGDACVPPVPGKGQGTAVLETPRGIAVHSVAIDGEGRVAAYDMVNPLQLNYAMLNERLQQVARRVVTSLEVTDAMAQSLQLAVRSFVPCVACGTH